MRLGSNLQIIEPRLSNAFADAADGEIFVFPALRLQTNLGKTGGDILTKAKLRVWPKFFNALRASAETDLMDEHGLRKACQWAGNSVDTAMKNYAMVRKTDFADVGHQAGSIVTKADAKSDARSPIDAKSDAEPASMEKNGGWKNRQKKHRRESERLEGADEWAILDLNKAQKHGEFHQLPLHLRVNPRLNKLRRWPSRLSNISMRRKSNC